MRLLASKISVCKDFFTKKEIQTSPFEQILVLGILLFPFLMIIGKLFSLNRQLSRENKQLAAQALNDPLTSLPHKKAIAVALDQELARSDRYKHTCSLLYLDIDDFKSINDTYGHTIGDAILQEFSELIRSSIRRPDTLGRWGGEEFLVILPETNEQGAQVVAGRIHTLLKEYSFSSGNRLRLSCSIGIATYPTTARAREKLIAAADQQMYLAKGQRHNKPP